MDSTLEINCLSRSGAVGWLTTNVESTKSISSSGIDSFRPKSRASCKGVGGESFGGPTSNVTEPAAVATKGTLNNSSRSPSPKQGNVVQLKNPPASSMSPGTLVSPPGPLG